MGKEKPLLHHFITLASQMSRSSQLIQQLNAKTRLLII